MVCLIGIGPIGRMGLMGVQKDDVAAGQEAAGGGFSGGLCACRAGVAKAGDEA